MTNPAMRFAKPLIGAALLALSLASPAAAAGCQNSGSFETWLESFRREAASRGISQRAIATSLDGVSYDRSVISHDRGQKVFKQTFEQFSGRMISSYRLSQGRKLILRNASLFDRIERQYGVPAPVLVAIWGLETDFGANSGKFPTIQALATLAYDCRRSDMFRAELFDALRIVERGDLEPSQMRGAWAGELGQTQFMPSSWIKFAVDYDGNGRRDLIHSAADVLASTANYLKSYGWQRGAGWEPGEPNFAIILQWNKSQVYAKTIAAYATRLR
jgi:lytic murein transglycosylase